MTEPATGRRRPPWWWIGAYPTGRRTRNRAPHYGPARRSAHQAPAVAERDRVRPVDRPELSEQAARVRLDGVLGQEQGPAELRAGPAITPAGQHLEPAIRPHSAPPVPRPPDFGRHGGCRL